MKSGNYHERLAAYLQSVRTTNIRFCAHNAQNLAVGITAVRDSVKEVCVYFDREIWELVHPHIWWESTNPPAMEDYGIGILCCEGTEDFTQALRIAQVNLKPKNGHRWRSTEVAQLV